MSGGNLKLLNLIAALAAGAMFISARAGSLDHFDALDQSAFLKLSEDLGAVAAYKGVTPATPLGVTGFDVGLEVTASTLQNRGAFASAGGGSAGTLYVPKVHVHKGLPGGFDIGAFVSRVSAANITLLGAEARYAIVDDGIAAPAIAVRLSGTRESGASQIELSTWALDAMISKKLTIVTPFAGVGTVRVNSNTSVAGLVRESFNKTRAFVGFNANFAVINLAVEAEKLGEVKSVSAKAGLRF